MYRFPQTSDLICPHVSKQGTVLVFSGSEFFQLDKSFAYFA